MLIVIAVAIFVIIYLNYRADYPYLNQLLVSIEERSAEEVRTRAVASLRCGFTFESSNRRRLHSSSSERSSPLVVNSSMLAYEFSRIVHHDRQWPLILCSTLCTPPRRRNQEKGRVRCLSKIGRGITRNVCNDRNVIFQTDIPQSSQTQQTSNVIAALQSFVREYSTETPAQFPQGGPGLDLCDCTALWSGPRTIQ